MIFKTPKLVYFFNFLYKKSSALLFVLLTPLTCQAQNAGPIDLGQPPLLQLVDKNGVDVMKGGVDLQTSDVAIGTGDAQLSHGLLSRNGVFSITGAFSGSWTGGVDDGPAWEYMKKQNISALSIQSVLLGGSGGVLGRGPNFTRSSISFQVGNLIDSFSPGYIDPANPTVISHYPLIKNGSALYSTGLNSNVPMNQSSLPAPYTSPYDFLDGSRFTYVDREGNRYTSDFVFQAHSPNGLPFGGLRRIDYRTGKTLTFNYEYKMTVSSSPSTPQGNWGWWRLRSIVSNYGYMLHYEYQDNQTYTQSAMINNEVGAAEYIKSVTAVDTNIDNCGALAQTCIYSRQWPTAIYSTSGKVDFRDDNGDWPYDILGSSIPPATVLPGQIMYSDSLATPTYNLTSTDAAGESKSYQIKLGSGYPLAGAPLCIDGRYTGVVYFPAYPSCMADLQANVFNVVIPSSGQRRDYIYGFVGGIQTPAAGSTYPPAYPNVSASAGQGYQAASNTCPPATYQVPGSTSATNPVIQVKVSGAGLWTYNFCGTAFKTIVVDPLGGTTTYQFGCSTNLGSPILCGGVFAVSGVTDELGRYTSYAYEPVSLLVVDSSTPNADLNWKGFTTPFNPKPALITHPEGNSEAYAYDSRGNVTSKIFNPSPGSGLTSIVDYQANYDAICGNPIKCNYPNWTKDANGNRTDYVYNAYGFVQTLTKPAGLDGVRPVASYTYTDFPTRDGSLLHLLTSETETIDATHNTTTRYNYDLQNHWYLKSKTDDSGGLALITCYQYDSAGNKIGQSTPRAGLTVCP